MSDLLIRGGRIIDPGQNMDRVSDLLISQGKINKITEKGALPQKKDVVAIDATGCIVCPGFIDLHCHLRDPGFEDSETIETGSSAAAKGGFTTVCCMPNTNPPLDNRASIEYVIKKTAREGMVRVLPIGCITKGRQGAEITEMYELADAGVIGFSDDGSTVPSPQLMMLAMEYSCELGLPIIDHCEETSLSKEGCMHEGWVSTRLGLKGIPAAAEEVVIARDIALAQLTRTHLHIAHVSSAGSVELIRRAKEKGTSVTAEVTPHHLTLTHERVMRDDSKKGTGLLYDTNAKVNPPLRTKEDIAALIKGINDGTIDIIATDHAPHRIVDKLCEFGLATFGISGFETALGSLMTLVHSGELDIVTLVSRLTTAPARILGDTYQTLGSLAPGCTADVTVFDPSKEWMVDSKQFVSKGKNTPFDGHVFKGKVILTTFNGHVSYKEESIRI